MKPKTGSLRQPISWFKQTKQKQTKNKNKSLARLTRKERRYQLPVLERRGVITTVLQILKAQWNIINCIQWTQAAWNGQKSLKRQATKAHTRRNR